MRKLSFFVLLVFLSSCLPKREIVKRPSHKGDREAESPVTLPSEPTNLPRSSSAEAYIVQYKDIAVSEMNQYGIPASIKLAQALLESGNGNSSLARNANNHFGIKCTSAWRGKTVLKSDDNPDDCFRVYNSAEESFRDHSEFLLRKRYAELFELDKDDYVGWAKGLKKAGYATNPRYAELLISLIERYGLHQYDRAETKREKIQREEVVFTEIVKEIPEEEKKEQAQPAVAMLIHEVKSGDTLYSISKKYGISVADVKTLNNLRSDSVNLGQLLVVSK